MAPLLERSWELETQYSGRTSWAGRALKGAAQSISAVPSTKQAKGLRSHAAAHSAQRDIANESQEVDMRALGCRCHSSAGVQGSKTLKVRIGAGTVPPQHA